ncbi:MAG: DNA ligase [Rubrivivax sp.]|nr:DNA ligase [Rubrivivax sp.]
MLQPLLSRRHLLAGLSLWPWLARAAPLPTGSTPPLVLAQEAAADIDPAPYLVSEKLDGVRAWWDGSQLRFRSGRPIAAPRWFIAGLPAQPLDGELWLGRGRFEALSAAVRRLVPRDGEWLALRYMLFELPGVPGPFRQRVQQLQHLVQRSGHAGLRLVEQEHVADRGALQRRLHTVVAGGGEGLMLHRADASFVSGRSGMLLKLKPLSDAEATVLAHVPGRGKHSGRLGALQVRTPQGVDFFIGTGFSDAERTLPPPLGSTVSFTHRGLTDKGVPRFASFLRQRDAE